MQSQHGHNHSHSHSHSHDFGHPPLTAPVMNRDSPWAHQFVCCDMDHAASSSTNVSVSNSPMGYPSMSQMSSLNPTAMTSSASTPITTDPMEMYTCNDSCAPQVECCVDPSCDPAVAAHSHSKECHDCGMDELEAWACTKEGCQAIQNYVSQAHSRLS